MTAPAPITIDEYTKLSSAEQRRYELPIAPGVLARVFDQIDAIESLKIIEAGNEAGLIFDMDARLGSVHLNEDNDMVRGPTEAEAFEMQIHISPRIVVDVRGNVFAGVAAALREHAERLQHLALQIDAAEVAASVDSSPGLLFEVRDIGTDAILFSSASRSEASRFAASQSERRDHYELRARPV